jgi:Dullard-like phosphatase family protein
MFPLSRRHRRSSFTPIIRPAIVFDLDETLVHTSLIAPRSGEFFTVRARRRHIFVQTRPGLAEFLTRIQKLYDVFFFTACPADYGNLLINQIAPEIRPCRRFFKDSCKCFSGYLVKDLSILRRPMDQILLVDDIAGSALANPMNLIRVKAWIGDPTDRVLLENLLPILENVALYPDLTSHTRQLLMKRGKSAFSSFPMLNINDL